MLSPDQFSVVSCQASIFTPDIEYNRNALFRDFLPKYQHIFDGDPVSLPTAKLPPEVPWLILQSANRVWKCEIGPTRVNFYQKGNRLSEPLEIHAFAEKAAEVLSAYMDTTKCRVGRVAIVVARAAPTDKPGLSLAAHFCRESMLANPLKRPENFELHAHKVYTMSSGLNVNSWVRNKTALANDPEAGGPTPVVLVEQDLNTLTEVQHHTTFSAEDLASFLDVSTNELDEIFSAYYGQGGAA